MKSPEGRQWVCASVALGAGVASATIIPDVVGKRLYVTSVNYSVGVSAAQPVTLESNGATVPLLFLPSSPTGAGGWETSLFRGVALPTGVGVVATAGGAGNSILFVVEGYYELISNS